MLAWTKKLESNEHFKTEQNTEVSFEDCWSGNWKWTFDTSSSTSIFETTSSIPSVGTINPVFNPWRLILKCTQITNLLGKKQRVSFDDFYSIESHNVAAGSVMWPCHVTVVTEWNSFFCETPVILQKNLFLARFLDATTNKRSFAACFLCHFGQFLFLFLLSFLNKKICITPVHYYQISNRWLPTLSYVFTLKAISSSSKSLPLAFGFFKGFALPPWRPDMF